jgi:hypothetical protein
LLFIKINIKFISSLNLRNKNAKAARGIIIKMRYSIFMCLFIFTYLLQLSCKANAKYSFRTFGLQSQQQELDELSDFEYLVYMRSAIQKVEEKLKEETKENERRRAIFKKYLEPRGMPTSVLYDLYSRFK